MTPTTKRRLNRFLKLLEACSHARLLALTADTLEKAWRNSRPNSKWFLMNRCGIKRKLLRTGRYNCPCCNPKARANFVIPAAVQQAFDRFVKTGKLPTRY